MKKTIGLCFAGLMLWAALCQAQTGSVQVTLQPAGLPAGAQWNVDSGGNWSATGGGWQNSGNTVTGLSPGTHDVYFMSVSGWASPVSMPVTITAGETTNVTGTYTPLAGSLTVWLQPAAALAAAAQWNVGGGAWQNGGANYGGLTVGSGYTVNYNTIAGWAPPASASVTISSTGATSAVAAYLQQTGTPFMTLTPLPLATWNEWFGLWDENIEGEYSWEMSPGVLLTGFSDYGGLGENVDWQLAPVLTGFYHGYMATSDTHYVDMLATCVDTLISLETIEPDGYPGWPSGGAAGTSIDEQNWYYADSMLADAAAFRPIVLMAYQMTTNPALKATYGAKGQSYLALAETLYRKWVWRGGWRDTTYPGGMISLDLPEGMDPATGYTTWITNPLTNTTITPNTQWPDSPGQNSYTSANEYGPTWINSQSINNGMSHPTNKADEVALWLLAMWDVTGNPEYELRASKWFTYLKNYRLTPGDEWSNGLDGAGDLIWNYWEPAGSWDIVANEGQNALYGDWGIGDTKTWVGAHPNNGYYWVDTQCIVAAFEHGVVFNEADINTLITDAKTSWTPSSGLGTIQYYFNPSSLLPGMSVSAYPASGTVQQVAGCFPNSLTSAASAAWPSVVWWNGGSYPSPLNGTIVTATWNGSTGTIVVKPTSGGANVTLDTNTSTEVWLLRMWNNFVPYDTQIQQQFEANEDTNPATTGSWGAVDDSFFLWLHSTLTVQSTPPTGLSIVSSLGQGYTTNYTIPGAEYGPDVNLQAPATDPTGYTFSKWTVNGTAKTAGLKSITFGRDGPTTVVAQYNANTYALTVQSTPPTGIVITSSSADGGTTNYTVPSVAYGGNVNLTAPATDPAGYTFLQWSVNGTAQTAGLKAITFPMPTATTAVAQYLPYYTLTVQSTPLTGVSISSSTGHAGTTNYTVADVTQGTSVNLAAPATDPTGYTFLQWSVNGTAQTAGLKPITFAMTAATTAVAQYTLNTYALTVQSAPPTGIVISSTSADGGTTNYTLPSVASLTSVNLQAPATDPTGLYTFSEWTVNGVGQTPGQRSITFTGTAPATTAVAEYTTYTLNVQSSPPTGLSIGSITGDGGTTSYSVLGMTSGASVNLQAPVTDPTGYTFIQWTVNGAALTAGQKSVTFTGPATYVTFGSAGSIAGQFSSPMGVAVSDAGDIYVADSNNNRIQEFTTAGAYVTQWGSQGAGNGQFNDPVAVAVDSAGNVYVADRNNNRIQKFTSGGVYVTQWGSSGSGNGQFDGPWGIAVNSAGNVVYVSDGQNNRIEEFTSAGAYVTQWGGSGSGNGQFEYPSGIAVDSNGNVYVADTGNQRIQKFTSAGVYITQWGTYGSGNGQFDNPNGLALDNAGNVYVDDEANQRIEEFTSAGTYITQWGSYGSGNAQFENPDGLAIDATGNVYVSDRDNDRIEIFRQNILAVAQYTPNYALTVQSTPPTGVSIGSSTGHAGTTNYTVAIVTQGTSVNLAAPATDPGGYAFSQWSVNGTAQTAGLKAITFTMTAATTAVAQYTTNTYALTVQSASPTGLSISSSTGDGGTTNYTVSSVGYGTSVNLQAPATDSTGLYTFSEWTVNGVAQTPGQSSITFPMPAAAATALAEYTTYTLNVQSTPPTGLSIGSSTSDGGTTNYSVLGMTSGASVNLAAPATDPAGYTFVQWTLNGLAQTTGQKAVTFPAADTDAIWGRSGSGNGQFMDPEGIALDNAGNVYVADTENNRIQKFTSSGEYVSQWGSYGSGNGEFNAPVGVAVDSSGNVYVSEWFGNRIQKFTSSGAYITQWGSLGSGNGQFDVPAAIAVDSAGNVYVADYDNLRVQKFTSTGAYVTKWGGGGTGQGQFSAPVGIALDSASNVYVVDEGYGARVEKFTSAGAFITQWGNVNSGGSGDGQFYGENGPWGIAVNSAGNVYVTDYFNARIQEFTSTGAYVTQWGSFGNGIGQLSAPAGLALDNAGNIYVSERGNNRIQVFSQNILAVAQYIPSYALTVQSTPPTGLSIGSSTGHAGTTNYAIAVVTQGTSVNLAAPATDPTGYTFTQWTVNGAAQTAAQKSITFPMTAATTAVAQYTLNTYALTVQSTPPTGLAVTSSSADGGTTNYTVPSVGYATSVNLAAPATDPTGYTFAYWTINGATQTAAAKSVTFTMPTAAVTAVAQYTLNSGIIYVKQNATGANNGTSWTNAFVLLQSALNAAASGDQIWVAAGTYAPTSDYGLGIGAAGDHFEMINGVSIYGGFAGTETLLSQRNWRANVATLSGGNTCYHVFYQDNSYNGLNLNSTAVLDGFTITGGNSPNTGGGVYNNSCSPTFENCVFSGNSATFFGGGMFNAAGSSTTVTNCAFIGNSATYGGGMDNGGSSPTVTNCAFSGNSATYGGGMNNDNSSPTVTNCTFSGNSATYGGGMCNTTQSAPVSKNCILWGDSATTGAEVDNDSTSTPTFSYSDIAGSGGSGAGWNISIGTDGGANIAADPTFVSPVAASFAPTTAGDYRLQAGSPCIDAGNSAAVPAGVTTDLDGNPRIAGPAVDMGAYEFQGTCNVTVQSTPIAGVSIGSSTGNAGTTNYTNIVAYDTSVNLAAPATDPTGYTFACWTINGAVQTSGQKTITFATPTNVTAVAQYTLNVYTLTVQSTPPTGIAVTSSTADGGTTNYTVPSVAYGASVNLVAPATDPTGYTFSQWTVNGAAQTAALKNITFTMSAEATTAVAQYTANLYTLTVQSTPPTGIAVTSSTADGGTTNYTVSGVAYGSSVNLQAPATDPTGYTFSKWTVNGAAQTAGQKSITFLMTAGATAVAQYIVPTYTLTVQSTPPTGVTITSSGADGGKTNYTVSSIAYGTSANLQAPATDPTGYTFSQWTVNGTAQTAGLKNITFTMTAATTAVAQYTANSYTLTVQSTPPTGIVITSSTADGGTTNYTYTVTYGTSVNLTAPATDPTGYTFSKWTVNGTAQATGLKSITFTMTVATTAVAQYTTNTYKLTVQSTPPTGVVITSSSADGGTTNYTVASVGYGTSVNLVAPATDPTGYVFSQWTVNGTAQTAGLKTITFTMTAATTAVAQYTTNIYTMTVQSTPPTGIVITSTTGDGGTTNYTVSGVAYGSSVKLTAPTTDPTGYTFSKWTVNGTAQAAGLKAITFTMTAGATAVAQYTTNTYTLTVQSTPPTGVVITSTSGDGGTTNYTVPGVAYKTSVNLTVPATDPTGYTFSKWTVSGTAQTAGLKSITFTMTAATTAVADYTANTYALTVQSTPPTGLVITSTTGDKGTTNYTVSSVTYGTNVNLTAPTTDPTGYVFSKWTVNGTALTAGQKNVTFPMPAAATAVAQYTPNTYTLTVQSSAPTGIVITSSGAYGGTTNYTVAAVAYETSVNLQAPATDPTGYTFSKWTVNGTAQTALQKSITFTVTAATTAVAQYTPAVYPLTVQSTPPTGVTITSTSADGGKTNYTVSSVAYNTNVSLTAPATDPTGYTFLQWTVNGTAQTAALKAITFTMTAATTAVAQYSTNLYTLTVQSTPPTGVVITSSGGYGGVTNYTVSGVAYGTSVNLTAPLTDPVGYTFSKWTVNGTAQAAGVKNITFTMTAATTAVAQYVPGVYTLTVQSTPPTALSIGSSTGDKGTTNYTVSSVAYGTSVNLQAPAKDPTGYTFSQWAVNGAAQTAGQKTITFTMATATTASAQYTLNTFALTVQSTPLTGVVIGSSSGDGWTTNYTMSSVGYGTNVNLAAPATDPAGYLFSQWTMNGTAQTAGLKSISFTMTAAVTALAQYTPVYTLTVQSAPPTGLVVASSSGDGWTTNYTVSNLVSGTSVNLAAPVTDPAGYTFSQWSLNGTGQTPGLKSTTFTMVAAVTAVAQYTLNTYPLAVQSTTPTGVVIASSGSDGGITNYKILSVGYGTSVNLQAPATDPSGYTFSKWTVNGAAQTAGLKSITFTMGPGAAGLYILDGYGSVHPVGNAPAFTGGPYWPGMDIAHALKVVFDSTGPVQGYYVLDGYGGVHPVGNVPAFSGGPYWPGVDIARDMDVVYNSTGTVQGYYILDGYGAVHPVGNVPAFTGGPYWPGFDIARSLAVVFNSAGTVQGYYILDGYGSVHPVGNVPAFSGGPYWPGFDIAHTLKVVFDSTGTVQGYYIMDGYAGIHPMGNVPAFSGGPYWPGWDIAAGMDLVYNSTGTVQGYYVLDGYGGIHAVGNVAAISGGPYWSGFDIARALCVNRTTATTAVAQYLANSYYTLTVQSTPPTGLGIGSSTGNSGATNYSTQVSVAPGTSVNLQAPATDPTGYTFSQWTVNGAAQTAGQKAITFTITANTTAAAQYSTLVGDALPADKKAGAQDTPNASSGCTLTVQSAPPRRTLITSSTADGGMTNYTVSSVESGTSVTLQAPATDPVGYTFSQWTLNGTAQTALQKAITFTVSSDTTAVAQYTANTYTLTVQATPATGIVIASSTACGGTTNYTTAGITYGTVVNLAAPATDPAGYTFSQWTLTGGQQPIAFTTSADLKSITFAMSADITAVAVYVKDAP